VVEALAGSGKTTTIVEAMAHTDPKQSVLAVAFNKSIAEELKPRVPQGVEVCTLHSFGLRTITRCQTRREIDGSWCHKQLREHMGNEWSAKDARSAVAKLVSIGKASLKGDAASLDALADAYGIELPDDGPWRRGQLIAFAQRVMADAASASATPIDFDDMIWLPVVHKMKCVTYDWVFVDETQDLNPAQLALVRMAAGARGRIVAVGDRRQAIYGFRGADREAIPRMIRELSAKVLPLSTTYRCASAIVAEAQRYVPGIEAAPSAAEGIVRSASEQQLASQAQAGDFVISRVNAPLVSLCYRWLAAGVRAVIRGKDIGTGLATWVKGTKAQTVEQLMGCITSWCQAECKRREAADRDCTDVIDKAECLQAIAEGCSSIAAVLDKIERLFSDSDPAGSILLSSTHRAKGLEAHRVWLLRDTYRPQASEEEANLLYVGITRAKSELIYVSKTAAAAASAEAA
jgi:superfamily I DNA/RNA helicase